MTANQLVEDFDKFPTKAQKREQLARIRMKISGASLKRPQKFAGRALAKQKKK